MKIQLQVVKSIAGSVFFKLLSAGVSLLVVPLLLKSFGQNNYAIWVTLSSLVAWLTLFDFGVGYSLKNRVTEMLATERTDAFDRLITGTLHFYGIIMCVLLAVFFILSRSLKIFTEHYSLAMIIYLPVILSFPFTIGGFILQGIKKFSLQNFILLAQVSLWLLVILLFRYHIITTALPLLAACYSILYFLTNLGMFAIALYKIKFNKKFLTDFSSMSAFKSSLNAGLRFFVLQISSLILFSMGNLLIYSHLFSKDVTAYDTVNKIYLMGMTLFNVVISVFWTEISHAKALQSKSQLLALRKKLLLAATVFSAGVVAVSFVIPFFIKTWTGGEINVNVRSLYPFMLLGCIQAFAYAGAVFLNAFEQLNGQILLAVISACLMIPFCKYFFSINMGIGTIPLSSSLVILPTLVYVTLESKKCIHKLA